MGILHFNHLEDGDTIMEDQLISYLKHGRSEQVRQYVQEQKKQEYSSSFTAFMDEMLTQYGIKRKTIADRSGLSQDYLYKLLRGDKKTTERDYILAICIAIGMNIAQTQHALDISGLPKLDKRDLRSHVIMSAVEDSMSIYELDEMLEKGGFNLLKVSPDMPSSEIRILNVEPMTSQPARELVEVDRIIEAEHCGLAPMDFKYWGILTVQDEEENKYFVEAAYESEYDHYIVLDEENYNLSQKWMEEQYEKLQAFDSRHPELKDNEMALWNDAALTSEYMAIDCAESPVHVLERFDSLQDAAGSEFFKFYLELDRATDKKVAETMDRVDDTRYFGYRVGAGFNTRGPVSYIEAFNGANPEKREYLQIEEYSDGTEHFSASHESCFMRMELGTFYPIYFGNSREPEYYLSVDNLDDIPDEYSHYYYIFKNMQHEMHRAFSIDEDTKMFGVGDQKLLEEEMENDFNLAPALCDRGEFDNAIQVLDDGLLILEKLEAEGKDLTVTKICQVKNKSAMVKELGNNEEWHELLVRVYGYKDALFKILEEGGMTGDACWAVADSAIQLGQESQESGEIEKAKSYTMDAITILEGRCESLSEWVCLFQSYTKYAFLIDDVKPEEAVEFSRKAINIAKKQHLDRYGYDLQISTLYNNHAWVLWNRLGREEAIIYYGMAIELLESVLDEGKCNPESVKADLKHIAEALMKLYLATNRKAEADRLKERLAENGINI